jgi:hypothetical protein
VSLVGAPPKEFFGRKSREADDTFCRSGITVTVCGKKVRLIPFDMVPRISAAGKWRCRVRDRAAGAAAPLSVLRSRSPPGHRSRWGLAQKPAAHHLLRSAKRRWQKRRGGAFLPPWPRWQVAGK